MNNLFIVREESWTTRPNYFVSSTFFTKSELGQLRHGQRVLEAQFLGDANVLVLPSQNLEYPSIFTSDGVSLLDPANWVKEFDIEIHTFLINDNFLEASGCPTIFEFIDWISLESLVDLFERKMFLLAMVDTLPNEI